MKLTMLVEDIKNKKIGAIEIFFNSSLYYLFDKNNSNIIFYLKSKGKTSIFYRNQFLSMF